MLGPGSVSLLQQGVQAPLQPGLPPEAGAPAPEVSRQEAGQGGLGQRLCGRGGAQQQRRRRHRHRRPRQARQGRVVVVVVVIVVVVLPDFEVKLPPRITRFSRQKQNNSTLVKVNGLPESVSGAVFHTSACEAA